MPAHSYGVGLLPNQNVGRYVVRMPGTKPFGRHQEKRLTAAAVRNQNEPGLYGDGHGLFLKVDASGSKRWVQRIIINGKRRDLGLGSASLVTLLEARETALQQRKVARAGGDPLAAKRLSTSLKSFEAVARDVHTLTKPTWRNGKHGDQWLTTMEKHAFPLIGSKRIDTITSADVMTVLTPIWNKHPETARRVKQRISTVLKHAIGQGWRSDDPAAVASAVMPKHDRSTVKHRLALPHSEVAESLRQISASKASDPTKLALAFLVHTVARSGEVRGATWNEVDKAGAVWVVPASRMKAKKAHRVPLTPATLAILKKAEALRLDGCDLIFPSGTGKPLSDMTLSKLVKELGIAAVPHGYRSSFRDWAGESNHPHDAVELALAHWPKDRAEAAYARSDLLEKRKKIMKAWSDYIIAN